MIRIWLDDERPAPDGWVAFSTARTCIAALDLLLRIKRVPVAELSLDHDLGEDSAGNGYQVLQWLEEQVFTGTCAPPQLMHVHSANAGARPKMLLAIESIQRRWESTR